MTDWSKLKVPDLKAELKNRGLGQTGLKAALIERLTSYEADKDAGAESDATVENDQASTSVTLKTEPNHGLEPELTTEPQIDQPIVESSPVIPIEPPQDTIPSSKESCAETNDVHLTTSTTNLPVTQAVSAVPSIDTSPSSSLPPVDSQDLKEDIQKRKRRSQSPPPTPTTHDASRKRARQDKDLPLTNLDNEDTVGASTSAPLQQESKKDYTDTTMYEQTPEKVEEARIDGPLLPHAFTPSGELSGETVTSLQEVVDVMDTEPDRVVTPSIHPATNALYVRDIMRPLNATALKDHIVKLAAPPGTSPDPDVIVDFFLDPIRTHAFVSFETISAASRVRSELHGRIWPDERNRQSLWVDFIPADKIKEWVEEEKGAGTTGRVGTKKWEIGYNFRDGVLELDLQEAGLTPASAAARKVSTTSRKLSLVSSAAPARPLVPTQPSARPHSMAPNPKPLPGVPSGPRAEQTNGPRSVVSLSVLDQLFKSTETKPMLFFKPVSEELVNKRLENMKNATSKHYRPVDGGGINRYTFEDTHVLVDRGPEIFPGIRPPPGHRGRGGGPRGGRGGRVGGSGRGGWGTVDRYEGRRYNDMRPSEMGGGSRFGRRDDRYRNDRDDRFERDDRSLINSDRRPVIGLGDEDRRRDSRDVRDDRAFTHSDHRASVGLERNDARRNEKEDRSMAHPGMRGNFSSFNKHESDFRHPDRRF